MKLFSKLILVATIVMAASAANAGVYFESFGDPIRCEPPIGCGNILSEDLWIFHRFQVEEASLKLERVGGVFTNDSSANLKAFAAVIKLTGPADYPNSIDLTSDDVLGVATFNLFSQTKNADYSADLPLMLGSGWYAMGFGMGEFGASTPLNTTIYMPTYLTDLAPGQEAFTALRSLDEFHKSNIHSINTEPRMYVVGSAVPEPVTMFLFGTGLAGAFIRRKVIRS